MGYKGYASPDAAAGTSPAGGAARKEPAKKADGSGTSKSASANDINGYNKA